MDSIDLLHSIFNKRETLYTLKDFETIINQAYKKDCEFDYFEGCLLDNAVIYAGNKNLFIGCKKRKYIILEEVVVSSWVSKIKMTETDDYEDVINFLNKYDITD